MCITIGRTPVETLPLEEGTWTKTLWLEASPDKGSFIWESDQIQRLFTCRTLCCLYRSKIEKHDWNHFAPSQVLMILLAFEVILTASPQETAANGRQWCEAPCEAQIWITCDGKKRVLALLVGWEKSGVLKKDLCIFLCVFLE